MVDLALFPLDYVLLPGLPLPLHVFEPRYRQLVRDVATAAAGSGHGSFGVVLGRAPAFELSPQALSGRAEAPQNQLGSPAYQAETRAALAGIGTVAEIVENEPYPDGRCDLLTVGSRRFRILKVDTLSHPYVSASVEFLDEAAGSGSAEELRTVSRLLGRYLSRLREVSDTTVSGDSEAAAAGATADGTRLSYDIAAQLQLTTSERQALLAAPTSADRVRSEIALLRRELAIFAHVTAVPVPARALVVPTGAN